MFTQESVFKAAVPVMPVISFITYESMKQETPPDGAEVVVYNVDENQV